VNKPRRHQTDLKAASICPASWDVTDGRRTEAAARGTAVHEFVERYNVHRAKVGRRTDVEYGRELISQILSEYGHMRPEIQEEIHMLCQGVIDTHLLNIETFYGSEETFKAELASIVLTGRLDELHISEDAAEIIDTKSNHVIPSNGKVAEDFQLRTYGFLVATKFPQLQEVKGTIYLPRYGVYRSAIWERDELMRWGEHLSRLTDSLENGGQKESVPNPLCQYCAASLPGGGCKAWAKTYGLESVVRSESEAQEAAKQIFALEQRLKVRRSVLQSYCKDNGKVDAGGRRFGYFESESYKVNTAVLEDALLNTDLDPYDYLSVSAADLKKLRRALGKEADAVIADISEKKITTRFSEKAIGTDE